MHLEPIKGSDKCVSGDWYYANSFFHAEYEHLYSSDRHSSKLTLKTLGEGDPRYPVLNLVYNYCIVCVFFD